MNNIIYPILAYGHPVLRKKSINIEVGSDIKQLTANMFDTLTKAGGGGLAAPQIGENIRLFIIKSHEVLGKIGHQKVFINPIILEKKGEPSLYKEYCYSLPGIGIEVPRKIQTITLRYFDENWHKKEETFTGIAARMIQHECDHLDGILKIDYASSLKKRLLKKKLINMSNGNIHVPYQMLFF